MSTLTDIINQIDIIKSHLRDLERPLELPRYRCLFVQTADVTVANTVTITSLIGAGEGITTLPAGFLTIGRSLRLTARGTLGTTGTPTLRLRFRLGGITVGSTLFTMTTVSGVGWSVQGDIVARTSGDVYAQGVFIYGSVAGAFTTAGTAPVTLSSTADVHVSAEWGTANALNTINCSHFTIEALN